MDFNFVGEAKRPIQINNEYNEKIDIESYYSNLEERLNEKYSIPTNILEELKEKINNENLQKDDLNNKNKKEYIINTLNIYSNNTIQFNSRNENNLGENKTSENDLDKNKSKANEEENIFETVFDYKKEEIKNEEEINELKNNLRSKKTGEESDKDNDRKKNLLDNKEINKAESDNENVEKKDKKKEKSRNKNKDKDKDKNKTKDSHKHSHKSKEKEKSSDKHNHKSKEKNKYKNKDKYKSHSKHKKHSEKKERKKSDNNSNSNDEDKDKDKESKEEKQDSEEKEEKKDKLKSGDNSDNNDEEKESSTKKDKSNEDNNSDKSNENMNQLDDKNIDDNSQSNGGDNNSEKKHGEKGRSSIKYSYTKQISKNTEKINSLLKDIRHSKIDKILKEAPKREETTLEKLIKYLKKNSKKLSLVERSWLVYKWVTENIEYDFQGVSDYDYDISEEATFNRGKSICSGYAGLYKKISEKLELEVERIEGFSKGFNFHLNENSEDSEKHEWNAVKIDDDWFLIEATWGSGYSIDETKFIKKFNPYFFFTPPQEFVRSHLPFEAKWQLLPKTKKICQKTFMAFSPLKCDFFNLGFNSIDPDYTFNYAKEKGKISLYFEKNKEIKDNLKVMGKLYFIEGEKEESEINNSILVAKKDDCFEVNYIINKKGEYKLKIFGNDGNYKEYNELCTLILKSERDVTKPKSFPTTTGLYHSSDMKIIQPLNGILKEGNKITFEFKASIYDKLFIGINTDESVNYIEMNKYNGAFKEEELLIYGKKVIISCNGDKENSYNTLLEYEVAAINKKKNTITYPKVFAGPKNKLIEPICDKLKKGKKVNFSLKCDSIEEIAVADGEDIHKLTKNKDKFTGVVKISGKGEVKIVFKKEGGEYGLLYLYKVI